MEDITKQKEFDRVEPEVKLDTSPLGRSIGNTLEHSQASLIASQLEQLLAQWKQFGIQTVTSTNATGAHIRTLSFDQNFYANHIGGTLGTQIPSIAMTFFSGFRADVEIRIEQVSMMQQQGATVVITTCLPSPIMNTMQGSTNIFNVSKFPRYYFKIGMETSTIFKIPWASNLDFWPILQSDNLDSTNALATNGYNQNGRLVHRVHSPLRIVSTATDFVTYRYWVRLTNLKLRVYQPKSGYL